MCHAQLLGQFRVANRRAQPICGQTELDLQHHTRAGALENAGAVTEPQLIRPIPTHPAGLAVQYPDSSQ
ncbi:Uncharacterised protein [Mycobacteroides abscessus subsp. abscessus]|nr:Uncharacterised protein [Mycobacteroides abscessus subsp. abscessus]